MYLYLHLKPVVAFGAALLLRMQSGPAINVAAPHFFFFFEFDFYTPLSTDNKNRYLGTRS